MHEISLMSDIMRIATEELVRHGGRRLTLVRVRYGVLNQIVPDAMRMAFDAFIAGTPHEGAALELKEEPRTDLRQHRYRSGCRGCGKEREAASREEMFRPCPSCGKFAGFECRAGDGIFLDHLEAE